MCLPLNSFFKNRGKKKKKEKKKKNDGECDLLWDCSLIIVVLEISGPNRLDCKRINAMYGKVVISTMEYASRFFMYLKPSFLCA